MTSLRKSWALWLVCELWTSPYVGLCSEHRSATYYLSGFLWAFSSPPSVFWSVMSQPYTPVSWKAYSLCGETLDFMVSCIPHKTVNHVTLQAWRFCNCNKAAPDRYLGQVFGLSLNSIKNNKQEGWPRTVRAWTQDLSRCRKDQEFQIGPGECHSAGLYYGSV